MHVLALAEETLRPAPRPRPFIQLVCGPLFVKVRVYQRVVLIQPPDTGHPTASFVRPTLFNEPSRGFGDEEDAYAEDQAKDESEGDDDSPGARVVQGPSADGKGVGQEDYHINPIATRENISSTFSLFQDFDLDLDAPTLDLLPRVMAN
jgi:hypothetical protein